MLTSELSHRVKNMLATVQAIATQTQRHSKSPKDFVDSFGGRIQSMARVHAQLSTNEWKGTALREIVHDQMKLGAVDESRISVSGPDVYIAAEAVPKMAMMLHELGTNSLKYGALSKRAGLVSIDWKLTGDVLNLIWSERGGPLVKAPIRRGFGSALIEQSAASSGGGATMAIGADGVHWDISMPYAEDILSASSDAALRQSGDIAPLIVIAPTESKTRALEGKRILIVEDEPLVAMDIADQLEREGAEIVGPVGTAASALDLIARADFDAALLDANLSGVKVDDIAAALTRKSTPFAFVSGYGRDSLPQSFASAEVLSKPFNSAQLIELATKLANREGASIRPLSRRAQAGE